MRRTVDWAQTHRAAMDSVRLLNKGKPSTMSEEEWADTVERNVRHLEIITEREWPSGHDLAPFFSAISARRGPSAG
jgi:hypothetical protein